MTEVDKKAEAVKRLLNNKDFREIIIEDYITKGALKLSLEENLRIEENFLELNARKLLNLYLYGIIDAQKKEKIRGEIEDA